MQGLQSNCTILHKSFEITKLLEDRSQPKITNAKCRVLMADLRSSMYEDRFISQVFDKSKNQIEAIFAIISKTPTTSTKKSQTPTLTRKEVDQIKYLLCKFDEYIIRGINDNDEIIRMYLSTSRGQISILNEVSRRKSEAIKVKNIIFHLPLTLYKAHKYTREKNQPMPFVTFCQSAGHELQHKLQSSTSKDLRYSSFIEEGTSDPICPSFFKKAYQLYESKLIDPESDQEYSEMLKTSNNKQKLVAIISHHIKTRTKHASKPDQSIEKSVFERLIELAKLALTKKSNNVLQIEDGGVIVSVSRSPSPSPKNTPPSSPGTP